MLMRNSQSKKLEEGHLAETEEDQEAVDVEIHHHHSREDLMALNQTLAIIVTRWDIQPENVRCLQGEVVEDQETHLEVDASFVTSLAIKRQIVQIGGPVKEDFEEEEIEVGAGRLQEVKDQDPDHILEVAKGKYI